MACCCCCCGRKKTPVTYDVQSLSPDWVLIEPLSEDWKHFVYSDDIEMVAKSWAYLTENGKDRSFGLAFFDRFFSYIPEAQAFFFPTKDLTESQLKILHRSPLFLSHVRRVVNGIDLIISSLRQPSKLEWYMESMKAVHKNVPGIKKVYAEIFVRTLEETVSSHLGKIYTQAHRRVFRKFLTKLYFEMAEIMEV